MKLTWGKKTGYGVGDFGLNIFWQGTSFYLLYYYTDVLGLPAATAGLIFAIGGFIDAITDPFAGYLGDRTNSRWGPYRPYLLLGSVPLAISFILLFSIPQDLSQNLLIIYALIANIIFRVCYTIVSIPYSSLGARITADAKERTIVSGVRMYFGFFGAMTVVGILSVVRWMLPDEAGYHSMALISAVIAVVAILITFYSTTSQDSRVEASKDNLPLIQSVGLVVKNIPFRLFMGSIALFMVAATFINNALLYRYEVVYNDLAGGQYTLLVMTSTPFVAIPFWSYIALRFGKVNTWHLSSSLLIIALLWVFSNPDGHSGIIMLSYALISFCISGLAMVQWSVLADTIEFGQYQSGVRNESLLVGIASAGQKFSIAISALILGYLMQVMGYTGQGTVADSTREGIHLITTLIPIAAIALSMILMRCYPLNERKHKQLVNQLDKRRKVIGS